MRKVCLFILLTVCLLPLAAYGRKGEATDTLTARGAFAALPEDFLDLLPRYTRLDMLDYFDNDSIWSAQNNLRGQARLHTVTPDYLSVRLSPSSRLQLKALDRKDGSRILMAIFTVGDDNSAADSEIVFFDSSLRELSGNKIFPQPKPEVFFDTRGSKTSMKEVERIMPFYSVVYEASPDSDTLKGHISYKDILTVEDTALIEKLARPEVVFIWNGKNFTVSNNK